MRIFLYASKTSPHPELVEGRTLHGQAILEQLQCRGTAADHAGRAFPKK
jgi:hypothetical protein